MIVPKSGMVQQHIAENYSEGDESLSCIVYRRGCRLDLL